MAQLLKDEVLWKKSDGQFTDVNASEQLANKVVAFYFSAHWCPPCRMFTPVLKDMYSDLDSDEFEVVFVSSDQSEDQMKDYMKESHGDWCAVKFGAEIAGTLKSKYGVSGIPMLVVVKPDGEAVVSNGRGDVQTSGKAPAAVLADWKQKCGL